MKIAIFHELLPGGARKVAEEQSIWLSKKHKVDFYYIDSREDKNIKKTISNIYFYKFIEKRWYGNSAKDKLYKDTIELYRLQNLHKRIAREIDRQKYEVVLVHPSKFTQSPFLLNFLNKPAVYYSQEPLRLIYDSNIEIAKNINYLKKIYEKFNFSVRKHIDKVNFKKAGLILVNSKFSKEWTERVYKVKNAIVCYLGVDTKKFNKRNVKKEYDFIFIGNKLDIEGYDLLLKMLYENKNNFKFEIIERDRNGKGMPEKDLIISINKARLVLCLSKSEPFGLIPLESMSCGVPVIAVNEGGYRETVINGKTGYLIKRSAKDLYDKINLLINNQKLLKNMENNCRKYILENWTWQKNIKILENILSAYIKNI